MWVFLERLNVPIPNHRKHYCAPPLFLKPHCREQINQRRTAFDCWKPIYRFQLWKRMDCGRIIVLRLSICTIIDIIEWTKPPPQLKTSPNYIFRILHGCRLPFTCPMKWQRGRGSKPINNHSTRTLSNEFMTRGVSLMASAMYNQYFYRLMSKENNYRASSIRFSWKSLILFGGGHPAIDYIDRLFSHRSEWENLEKSNWRWLYIDPATWKQQHHHHQRPKSKFGGIEIRRGNATAAAAAEDAFSFNGWPCSAQRERGIRSFAQGLRPRATDCW